MAGMGCSRCNQSGPLMCETQQQMRDARDAHQSNYDGGSGGRGDDQGGRRGDDQGGRGGDGHGGRRGDDQGGRRGGRGSRYRGGGPREGNKEWTLRRNERSSRDMTRQRPNDNDNNMT